MIRYTLLLVYTLGTGKIEIPFLHLCTSFEQCAAYGKILETLPVLAPGISFRCVPDEKIVGTPTGNK